MDLQTSIITGAVIGAASIFALQYMENDAKNQSRNRSRSSDDASSDDLKENREEEKEDLGDQSSSSSDISRSGNNNGAIDEQKEDELFEKQTERIIKKTEELRKKIGVSDELVRESFRDGRSKTSPSTSYDEGTNIFKLLDKVLLFAAIFGLCYLINKSTNGDFMRAVVGMFPKEAKTLGVKDYFERIAPLTTTHHTISDSNNNNAAAINTDNNAASSPL